eukprot:Selendium_serpulae@DN10941_c0_g1_i1.p2
MGAPKSSSKHTVLSGHFSELLIQHVQVSAELADRLLDWRNGLPKVISRNGVSAIVITLVYRVVSAGDYSDHYTSFDIQKADHPRSKSRKVYSSTRKRSDVIGSKADHEKQSSSRINNQERVSSAQKSVVGVLPSTASSKQYTSFDWQKADHPR